MVFYFAWVGPDETTFSSSYLREDETVLSFDITHQEGQIPLLSIDVRNPHIGLLAAGRAQWCWLSIDGTPLFHGRLVALPSNLLAEVVTLQFIARPRDFLAQKYAVANSLKVAPYYDELWIDKSRLNVTDVNSPYFGSFDPDVVLETYSSAWHIDRVSNQVTISDITLGEDGDEIFEPHEVPYDSVALEFGQNPTTAVWITASVNWQQGGAGASGLIEPTAGLPRVIETWGDFSGEFPKRGTDLGGGWTVVDGFGANVAGTAVNQTEEWSYENRQKQHRNGDTMSAKANSSWPGWPSPAPNYMGVKSATFSRTFGDPYTGQAASISTNTEYEGASGYAIAYRLVLQWKLDNGRKENIQFLMTSDAQPIATSAEDEPPQPERIQLDGGDIGPASPTDATGATGKGGSMVIGDASRGAFFPTERGISALQYPMLIGRAHLMLAMRAVKVTFECTIERALTLSCRKNALLYDPRLPGGQALGKITEYHIKADGDAGLLNATVQIGSTVGNGGTPEVSVGIPEYADEDYIDRGYQFYNGEMILVPTEDIAFVIPADPLVGVLPVGNAAIVKNQWHFADQAAYQEAFNKAAAGTATGEGDKDLPPVAPTEVELMVNIKNFASSLNAAPTWYELELLPVAGFNFEVVYDLSTSPVTGPMMIDLSAGSTP